MIISNKSNIVPKPKPEPEYIKGLGWYYGYPFSQFWGNCHAILGDVANQEGYQQLCHHYYLHNGSLGAADTVKRIKGFLGGEG